MENLAVVHMLHREAELHEVVEHLVRARTRARARARARARLSSCGLGFRVDSSWSRWYNEAHLLLREHGALTLLEEHVELAALAKVHHDVQRAALDE